MGVLTVVDSDGTLNEYQLSDFQKENIVFGRNPELCDIVVSCPFVSGKHGQFKWRENTLYYADLGSMNGSVICRNMNSTFERNSEYYTSLNDGDFVTIRENGDEDVTNQILILYSSVDSGDSWNRISIGKKGITIGRDVSNDIVLEHVGISKFHANVYKDNMGYIVRDRKSENGILWNGMQVYGHHILKDNDIITIMDTEFIFCQECLFYRSSQNGITLTVNHLSKKVNKNRYILQDVNLDIKSNEFVAIVGGSGAGKSTLMHAISGFDEDVSGTILCNGIDLQKNFSYLKEMIGLVPQEDIIYDNLTLEKMLYYTALLKMPKDTTKDEMNKQINDVLEMVELSEHRKTYIRKMSGGQKKRASIAVELLASPRLFFLDEPTSGLDPGTEKNLMQTLNRLSKLQGKTILMVTHTTQNLHLCDKIIFMGPGGRLVFFGTVDETKEFFETDNLVDVYNKIAENPDKWIEQFEQRHAVVESKAAESEQKPKRTKKAGFMKQMGILTMRYMELIKNDWQRFSMLFLQPLLIALLLCLVASKDSFEVFEDTRSILFALSCAGIWIGLFNSIQEICKERSILRREYMGNLRLSAYVISKFLVQALIGLVQAVLILSIFTVGVGHAKEGLLMSNPYGENLMLVWLTILAASTLGLLVSSLVRSTDKAMVIAPFVLIVQLLFSGILFELKGAGEWIAKLTISKWSVEGLGTIANLNELTLKLQQDIPTIVHEAEDAYEYTKGHLCQSYAVMAGMCLLCLIICTIALRSLSKDKR